MDKSQTPQVWVPGEPSESTQPEPNATANHNSTEVEMGDTQDTSQPEPKHVQDDSTLPDVQAEPGPPASAKKKRGLQLL